MLGRIYFVLTMYYFLKMIIVVKRQEKEFYSKRRINEKQG